MALPESQALLHCIHKGPLYTIEMTIGNRIKAARERLDPKPTQAQIGKAFGVTVQAVSGWERDETIPELAKIAKLARLLQVPCTWLLEGTGAPPPPDTLEVRIQSLRPRERAMIGAMIDTLHKQHDDVA